MKNVFLIIVFTITFLNHVSAVDYSTCSFDSDVSIIRTDLSVSDGDSTIPVFFYNYYDQFYGSTRVRFFIGELIHFGYDTSFIRINEYAAMPYSQVLTVPNEQEMTDSSISVPFIAKSGDAMRIYWDFSIQTFTRVNGIDTAVISDSAMWMGVKDTVVFYLDIINSDNMIVQVLDTIGVRSFDNIFEEGLEYIFIKNGPRDENDTAFVKQYTLNIGSADSSTVRLRIRPHLGPDDGEDRFNMQRTNEMMTYLISGRTRSSRDRILEERVNTLSPCINGTDKRGSQPARNNIPKPYNISVTPSPANGITSFTFYNPSQENVFMPKCWLMDINGRAKKILDLDGINSGLSFVEIDLSGWPAGSYFVYLTSNTRVLAKESFIIVH